MSTLFQRICYIDDNYKLYLDLIIINIQKSNFENKINENKKEVNNDSNSINQDKVEENNEAKRKDNEIENFL